MSLLRTLFRRARQPLRIVDDQQAHLAARYGGGFRVNRLTVFDEEGRLRGFVFVPGDPTAARIQSFVAGARKEGLISEELVRVLLSRIQLEDFFVKPFGAGDVLVFPADIYHGSGSHRVHPSRVTQS
jgi:hypothetical protein